jgi:hypothetical protein
MRHASYDDTGLTVAASDLPIVLLNCLRCPRRVVVKPADLKADQARPIYQCRLRCSCGSYDVQRFLCETADDEARFLDGFPPLRAGAISPL